MAILQRIHLLLWSTKLQVSGIKKSEELAADDDYGEGQKTNPLPLFEIGPNYILLGVLLLTEKNFC